MSNYDYTDFYKKLSEITQTEQPYNTPLSTNLNPQMRTMLEEGMETQKDTNQFIKTREDTQYNMTANIYENLLKRKIAWLHSQKLKYSFVSYVAGHKDSEGNSAPWTIKDHADGHIISSHKTEQEAKKHLQDMHAHS